MTRAAWAVLLLCALARAGDVAVRVTLSDEPVPDADVKALRPDDGVVFDAANFQGDARTDAAGVATVKMPDGGKVLVYVPGFVLAVAVPEGATADVELEPELTFRGRVVDDRGGPLGGVVVSFRTTFKQPATFKARTDAKGYFFVYGLWFDNYAIAAETPGHAPVRRNVTEDDRGLELELPRLATVFGTVRDPDGKPVAGVDVELGGDRQKTGADGSYRFEGARPGRRSVSLREPWGGRESFALEPGETREADVVALAPATLRLQVVDEADRPLKAVEVMGWDESRHAFSARLPTDAQGRAAIRVPARRGVTLMLAGERRSTLWHPVGPQPPGAETDLGTIAMPALPEVEVRVRRPDGTAPERGKVGDVALDNGVAKVLAGGPYRIEAPGFPTIAVDVEPPGPQVVDLYPPRWVEGLVLDAAGAPVEGATVTGRVSLSRPVQSARSDAGGRFRVGPFVPVLPELDSALEVQATRGAARSREVPVIGDGELELRLAESQQVLVRGLVVRDGRPVRRFSISGKDFVDEGGRFEILVDRAERDWIAVRIDDRSFPFALPASGEELVAEIPRGEVRVGLAGAAPGRTVTLRRIGEAYLGRATTDEGGVARFEGLAPGTYTADADGFASREFTFTGDPPPVVTLQPATRGVVRIRPPPGAGAGAGAARVVELEPGVHRYEPGRSVFVVRPALVAEVRVLAGRETLVDLDPPQAGSLTVSGPSGSRVALDVRLPDALVRYNARLTETGRFVFPNLPPGTYAVELESDRRTVDVLPGGAAAIAFERPALEVTGRVQLVGGRPAQGVEVRLRRDDFEDRTVTDLRGAFRFESLAAGEYKCVAGLGGYAPASAAVTAGESAILTLERATPGRARIVGPAGAPVLDLEVRVDGVLWRRTDALGRLALDRPESRIDLDLRGYASIRGLVVRDGDVVRLERGASLVVLHDADPERLTIRVNGAEWRRLREVRGLPARVGVEGRVVLEDLPAGVVEVEVAPEPPEDEDQEPEEPRIVQAALEVGAETRIDLLE